MNEDPRMGEVIRDGEQVGLRYVRRLAHPRERVWRAITESDELRHWMPADIVGERAEGAEVEVVFWPQQVEKYGHLIEEPVLHGRILTWRPPELFEWTWDTDFLRWELAEDGEGTLLTFTTWLGDGSPDTVKDTAAGYHICLDQLEGLVDGGPAGAPVDVDPAPLEAAYAARLGG